MLKDTPPVSPEERSMDSEGEEPRIPLPRDCWSINNQTRRRIRNYRADSDEYLIEFWDDWIEALIHHRGNVLVAMHDILEDIIDHLMRDFGDEDMVGMVIEHPELTKVIFVPMTRRDQFNADRVLQIIERIMQSNEQFTMDGNMTIRITRVETMEGGKPPKSQSDLALIKQSIVRIKNHSDDMCLARSIVTAIAHYQKKNGENVNWLSRSKIIRIISDVTSYVSCRQ